MNEKEYMKNARGGYDPISMIKPIDLARDSLVKEIVEKSQEMSRQIAALKKGFFDDIAAFDAIDEYLRSFGEVTDRLTAACNLSFKLREAVNYYTELDMLQSEQAEMAQ
ncbi:DUF3164 family protein [Treponema sp.]|uniref:DUF3164 family protein n=1 Tax=Treponema sp. TaxID=166 RepID=UPI003FA33A82